MRLIRRLQYLVQQRRRARELAEEIEQHRAMVEQDQRSAGVSTVEARAAASRQMGNATLAREQARGVWLASWIESVFQDLRYAVRSLRNEPGFTAMALIALTLGIGLNTSLFTGMNAVLFRGWDVPDSDRMVKLYGVHPRFGSTNGLSVFASRYFNEHSRTITGAFAQREYRVALDQSDGPRSTAYFVGGSYFGTLHVGMAMGRAFTLAEDLADSPVAVAVLSHDLWINRYGGDPAIIGRTIRIDDIPFTVVGVAEQKFRGTSEMATDLWAPLASVSLARPNGDSRTQMLTNPAWCCAEIAARLAPDVSRTQAEAELNTIFQQAIGGSGPDPLKIVVTNTAIFQPEKMQEAVPAIALVLAAVGSILLLACANVGNLLLARSAARQREIAVRVAIGAGRRRVIRQLLTESLLLASIASGFGLALAFGLPAAALRVVDQIPPANVRITPDLTVLAYAVGIAFAASIAFGLAPALYATRVAVSDAIKRQSGQVSPRFRLRGVLLGVQVAISVTLLVAASLLLRGVARAEQIDPGFRTEGLATVKVELPVNSYNAAQQRIFFDDLLGQLRFDDRNQPVGISAMAPLSNLSLWTGFNPAGRGTDNPSVRWQPVNAEYIDLLQMPILAGRNFLPGDRASGGIIINEALAGRFWRGPEAVGQTVTAGQRTHHIVGVVRDSQLTRLGESGQPMYFAPFGGSPEPVLLVAQGLASRVEAAVRLAEPRAQVEVAGLAEQVNRSLTDARGGARIAGALGLLALILATVGVYGVISYSVEQRRKEIGIRLALGARPVEVVRMILRRNGRAVGIGLAAGLALSLGASMALRSAIFGLSPMDPIAWGGVLGVLCLAGLLASVIPARRAARTDAVASLYHE